MLTITLTCLIRSNRFFEVLHNLILEMPFKPVKYENICRNSTTVKQKCL